MAEIITRAGKGAALSHPEMDSNLDIMHGIVEQQVGATYTVVYTDQGKTIELNNASMVCTLDAIATIAAAIDTSGFIVKLKNINAAAATIQRSSTDTINGATSITLAQGEAIVLQTDTTGGIWTIISTGRIITGANLYSPVIIGSVSGTAVLDEDDMASDSATQISTQQAIKAYVDARTTGGRVDSAGTMTWTNSAYTSARIGTGQYRITHNLGSTNYSSLVGVQGNTLLLAHHGNVNINDFLVFVITISTGSLTDGAFHWHMTI